MLGNLGVEEDVFAQSDNLYSTGSGSRLCNSQILTGANSKSTWGKVSKFEVSRVASFKSSGVAISGIIPSLTSVAKLGQSQRGHVAAVDGGPCGLLWQPISYLLPLLPASLSIHPRCFIHDPSLLPFYLLFSSSPTGSFCS